MHWSDDHEDDTEQEKSDKGKSSGEEDSDDDDEDEDVDDEDEDEDEEEEFPSPSALGTTRKKGEVVAGMKNSKEKKEVLPPATVRRRRLAPVRGVSSSLLRAWTPEGGEEGRGKGRGKGRGMKAVVNEDEVQPRKGVEGRNGKTKAARVKESFEDEQEEEEEPRRTRVELRTRKTKGYSLKESLESKPEEEQEYVSAREEVSILEDVSMFDDTFHSCESEEDPQDDSDSDNDDEGGSYTEQGSDDDSEFDLGPPPRKAPAAESQGRAKPARNSNSSVNSSQSKKAKAKNLEDRFLRLRLDNIPLPPPQSMPLTISTPTEEPGSSPPSTPPRPAPAPRPKGLVSPTKLPRIPNTPHRPSTDMFWSQEFVEDWNDQHSPAKQLFPSKPPPPPPPPRPPLPTTTSKPPSSSSFSSSSPAKKTASERQSLKEFETNRLSLAETFLSLLDTRITSSQLSTLSASTGGIKIIWSRTLATTAGRANWKRETFRPPNSPPVFRHHCSIELSTKVITTPHRLYNVLAHEFCHLCNFMISGITTNPHGKEFKAWGKKVTGVFGKEYGIEVTTKHTYEIEFRYAWECGGCGMGYKRHSKSIDVGRHRCGVCKGVLVQVKPTPRGGGGKAGDGGGGGGGGQEKKQSAYQIFMKVEMKRVKAEQPGIQQKDVMKVVAERWKAEKERNGGVVVMVAGSKEETPEVKLPVRGGKKEIEVVDLT